VIDLERRLEDLGRHLDYPGAANLAAAVGRRARQAGAPRPFWRRALLAPVPGRSAWPSTLLAAAAIAVVVIAALVAFPPSRDAIAGFLGLRGLIVQRVPLTPSAGPSNTGPLGRRLALGNEVTLAQARAAVPYPVLLPASLGEPDQVYLLNPSSRQAVALVYLPRAGLPESAHTGVGLLLIEFPGKLQSAFMEKMLGPDATLEQVSVDRQPGFWVSGSPHGFLYLDQKGEVVDDTYRLAGNTLIWNQGSLLLRIEADIGKEQALAVAASLR